MTHSLPTNPSYRENHLGTTSKAIKEVKVAEGNLDASGAYKGFGIFYTSLKCHPVPTSALPKVIGVSITL